ncbi:MAG TPA: hypothetical protein VIE87_05030 [Pseudolabrys sp.]|jgi:hypothetical protein
MPVRFIVCLCALLAATNGASAAILSWGCQTQVGDQQLIFNRYSLVITDTKIKMGDIRKLRMSKIDLPPGSPPHVNYDPPETDDGFTKIMEFTRHDDPKRKLTLMELSSRKLGHQHHLICGRDEDIDLYRKVYRYQREDESARTVTMQCMDYQLSTRAGRKGCNDD